MKEKVYEFLREQGVEFEVCEHPATPTVELARLYWDTSRPVQHCKNLFLRNHKGNRHYLVIIDSERTLDIQGLARKIGDSRLSFASEARMMKYLGVTPGSVSVFGLLNDATGSVRLLLDGKLRRDFPISFHPNDNTASLTISHADFLRILPLLGNPYSFVDLD